MSTGQWVQLLTEDGLTMEVMGTARQYIPCRAEITSPTNDWERSWSLCRLSGLGSDLTSFNFKVLHKLLPTKQSPHYLTQATPATCTHCEVGIDEDIEHALIHCNYNCGVGQVLLTAVQHQAPDTTVLSLLHLELTDLPEESVLSLTTFISAFLLAIWERRQSKSRMYLYDIRATLEARCLLLRETRYGKRVSLLKEMINSI